MATRALPDARGHFGPYGGRYVPETLMAPLIELERAWRIVRLIEERATRSSLGDDVAEFIASLKAPLRERP